MHCVSENDTYVVEFFVDDELYWEREVEVTTCGECEDCNITAPDIIVAKNDCGVFLCTHGESNSCGTASYQWDMGDGNVYNDKYAIHDYMGNGTYTCLLYTSPSPRDS